MSNKTISKFHVVVIPILTACAFVLSCSQASSSDRYAVNTADVSPDYQKPVAIGKIESNEITESSGLAASPCQRDVFWTHNDAGDDAYIFAISSKGAHLGTWRVTNAQNVDWEDMAAYKQSDGTCVLYIGDVGNNKLDRSELRIYRVKEPVPGEGAVASSKKNPLQTDAADYLVFKYSDTPHNAETMMAQPKTGDLYVLTKRLDGPSLVFKIKPQFGSPAPVTAEKVGEVSLPAVPNGLLTGGAVSPDGTRVIMCDYSAGYELVLRSATASFDEIWKQKPIRVDLGDRRQGEAVTFTSDGSAVIATSEKKNSPVIEAKLK